MRIKNLLLSLLLILPYLSNSQSNYLIGTSQEAIEPDQSLISLHLGGYGAPKDGRFTLQWMMMGTVPEPTAFAGLNDKLYIVSKDDLWSLNPSENIATWAKAGKAENIRSIAGFNNELYGINANGELLKTKVKSNLKWKKIGSVDKAVTVIAAYKNQLFGAGENGSLWSANLSGNRIEWTKVETIRNSINPIISLTANNRKLYALTSDDVIYQCEPGTKDSKWLKTAYRNGESIKEDIKYIAVFGDRLFGVSKENMLCRGEHRSEGNISARAMAIKSNETTVVIVNVDVCGLNDVFTGTIKHELFLKDHLPAAAIFINSSHTHFAPVTQNVYATN